MGFVGPESSSLEKELQVELDARGNIARDANWMTNVDGLFVAGDAGRGQTLYRVGYSRRAILRFSS
ncbi:MAG: hypothetical protein Ct9H90mP30_7290 [Actinomycetota bacterium]|nr:MAG: hypothetical protein Ct9H90mP30_7290 [Actinomycetota bacterium]